MKKYRYISAGYLNTPNSPIEITMGSLMEKVIHCREVGFDCDGVIRATTEEEALRLAAEHAKSVHGIKEVTPEVVEKIKSVMREEPPKPK